MDRSVAERAVDAALLVAKITLPPREFHPYVEGVLKKITEVFKRSEALHKKLSALNTEQTGKSGYAQNVLTDWTIEPGDHWPDELIRIPLDPKGYRDKDTYRHTENIPSTLSIIKKQKGTRDRLDFIKYLANDFGYIAEDLKRHFELGALQSFLAAKDWVAQTWKEYAGEYGSYNEYVEEGINHLDRKGLEEIDQHLRDLDEIQKLAAEAQKRIMQVHTQSYQTYYDSSWVPEHEKIEPRYHATVNAPKLYRTGFQTKVPGPKGLGGAQSDKCGKPAISFTSDLRVAKEVMRGLKEAIMIAKGQVRLHDVIDWAKRAGVGKPILTSVKVNKRKDEPGDVMFVYREYMMLQRKRYDPVFFGDMRQLMRDFKKLNPKDVGILVADIDMSNQCIKYLATMQEYRIAPEAVVKIKKLIRG